MLAVPLSLPGFIIPGSPPGTPADHPSILPLRRV